MNKDQAAEVLKLTEDTLGDNDPLSDRIQTVISFTVPLLAIDTQQLASPANGATVTVTTSRPRVIVVLTPAATIAGATIALPGTPANGDKITVCTSQIITTLTVSGGTTVGAPTTMALGAFFTLYWNATGSKWYRIS